MKLYKYTTADYGLVAIRDRRLKVSTLADINDPNEWLPIMRDPDTGEDWHSQKVYRQQYKNFWAQRRGFISFSRLYASLLMWGHYADKFRGVALAFEVLDASKIIDVRYICERFELGKKERENPSMDDFENLISRKDWCWAYEQECRTIVNLQSCTTQRLANGDTIYFESFEPERNTHVLKLMGIVLGSECTVTMEDIHEAFNKKPPLGFQVLQLSPDSTTYSLVVSGHTKWNGVDWTQQVF